MSNERDDGWIEWRGGACPVETTTRVEVRYRSPADHLVQSGLAAWEYDWHHENAIFQGGDIIAYRVLTHRERE